MTNYKVNVNNAGIEYELFESLRRNNLSYIYRGDFTPAITDNILNLVETGFVQSTDKKAVRRKIYNVMVEGLQNVIKHQANPDDAVDNLQGVFILKREQEKYLFTTCNLIENKNIESLSQQIEHVNKLDKYELKDYYKKILVDGTLSSKGGAGLGLIDICLKSGSKLSYSFETVNDIYSFFYFHSEIASSKNIGNENWRNTDMWVAEKRLHRKLNKNNILVIFNSYFSQESMIGLLSIIEKQMAGRLTFKKRMYSMMVEMMQNVIKHADSYESTEDGKAGLFYISEKSGVYTLHSGNYASKEKVMKLKNSIDIVNSLNPLELEERYEKQLLNHDDITNEESGLGIIDMKMKSNNNIELDIFDVNSDLSFCVLRTRLKRK